MATPYRSIDIRWSIGSQDGTDFAMNGAYPANDIDWFQYPIPAEMGHAGFSSLKLSSGMALHRSIFRFNADIRPDRLPRLMVRTQMLERTLAIHAVLAGRVNRLEVATGTLHELTPGCVLIQTETESGFTLLFDSTDTVEMLYLDASESSLKALLGDTLARQILGRASTLSHATTPLPRQVISPLQFCLDNKLDGSLHKLHAQTKTLEFFSELLRHLGGRTPNHPLGREGRAAAVKAHIVRSGLHCPNLPELARLFGLTPKTLNTAFVRAYGMSVSRFIREQRLTIAHEQLQNSNLPLREICARLGYSQVSNFSTAFKEFFGYSPTTLRRKVMPRTTE